MQYNWQIKIRWRCPTKWVRYHEVLHWTLTKLTGAAAWSRLIHRTSGSNQPPRALTFIYRTILEEHCSKCVMSVSHPCGIGIPGCLFTVHHYTGKYGFQFSSTAVTTARCSCFVFATLFRFLTLIFQDINWKCCGPWFETVRRMLLGKRASSWYQVSGLWYLFQPPLTTSCRK